MSNRVVAQPAQKAAQQGQQSAPFRPQPTSIEDTGIGFTQVAELCLKAIHARGRPSARHICDTLCLPFTGVIEPTLAFLKREKLVDLVGAGGMSEQQYEYVLSEKGTERANEALERSQYLGPAPVPFEQYVEVVKEQSIRNQRVDAAIVDEALGDLILSPTTRNLVGPAVNSGRSILLYGEPGNGKSSIAKGIRRMLRGEVLIPYAIDVNGRTIRVYDSRVHQASPRAIEEERRVNIAGSMRPERRHDTRWVVAQRPLIITGGELTLADLDLKYSPQSRFYIAPVQMKANCGVLVIDDLGRQIVQPKELLNRWIVPMESRVDNFSLISGETIEVPFELLLVFSTNLNPSDLGDEAFFRRIRHKIEVPDPDEAGFLKILRNTCAQYSMPYSDALGRYLIDRYYRSNGRHFRAVHPRDLVDLVLDISSFQNRKPEFSPEWIDLAAASYFIDDKKETARRAEAAQAA